MFLQDIPISEWTVFTNTQNKVTIIEIKFSPDFPTFDHPIFRFIWRAIDNFVLRVHAYSHISSI
jgi:hypothetical protein